MKRSIELTDSQRIRILESEIQVMRRMLVTQLYRIEEILGVTASCDQKSMMNTDKTIRHAERLYQ